MLWAMKWYHIYGDIAILLCYAAAAMDFELQSMRDIQKFSICTKGNY
jgi:hypothetical protein